MAQVRRYPDAVQDPGVVIFRFDGPIVFANRDFLKQTLVRIIAEKQAHRPSDDGGAEEDDESWLLVAAAEVSARARARACVCVLTG